MSDKLDNSICLARWEAPSIHLHTGKVKTCCRTTLVDVDCSETMDGDGLFNNKYFQDRRQEMLNGVRDGSCSYCWELEKNGMQNPREGLSRFLDYREKQYNEDKSHLLLQMGNGKYDANLLVANKPTTLEISIGNTCDLKCLYCCPEFSTSWALEEQQHSGFRRPEKRDSVDIKFIEIYFWDWMEKTAILSLKDICLIGGEPLLIPGVDQMIFRIAELARQRKPEQPRLKLAITSNFNSNAARFEKFLKTVNQASETIDIELRASVESYGVKAEYIRSGLLWEHMKTNLKLAATLTTPNVTVAIASTHNALSISSFPELIDFVEELMFTSSKFIFIHFNMVMFPTWISIDVLPKSFSDYVFKAVDKMRNVAQRLKGAEERRSWEQSAQHVLNLASQIQSNNPSPERITDFKNHIKKYEERRHTSFINTFPELSELMNFKKSSLFDQFFGARQ